MILPWPGSIEGVLTIDYRKLLADELVGLSVILLTVPAAVAYQLTTTTSF